VKHRDLVKILKDSGFQKIRDNGDHEIDKAKNKRLVQAPRPKEISENTARQILKDAGLK
jgi:mRNA interferase HicA